MHPGFRKGASIVLHRHATDPDDQNRLDKIATFNFVQTRDEIKILRKGRRNTPALFGAGLIDAIPDRTLREAELHDMGEASSDSATYYGSPAPPRDDPRGVADAKKPAPRSGLTDATEWRTPPLWGIGDSAPYFHDGRSDTLDAAIRRHDGEAAKTVTRYSKLASTDRRAVLTFLSSLKVSPERKKPAGTPRKRPTGAAQTIRRGVNGPDNPDPAA